MIITGNNKKEISSLQEYLATEFEKKNLVGLKYFLGIEVAQSRQGIFLSQRKYVLDLLSETGMLDCRPLMHQSFKTMVWENSQIRPMLIKRGISFLWKS